MSDCSARAEAEGPIKPTAAAPAAAPAAASPGQPAPPPTPADNDRAEPAAADTGEEGPAAFVAAGGAKAAASSSESESERESSEGAREDAEEPAGEPEVVAVQSASVLVSGEVEVIQVRSETALTAGEEAEDEGEASSEESDLDYAAVLERLQFLMMGGEEEGPPTPQACSCPSCLALRASGEVDELGRQSVREPLLSSFDLEGVAKLIKSGKVRRIVCMCGAGISVSAGIPDFRSPGSGLYHRLEAYDLPYPQAVFEIDFFRQNPRPFFLLARELFPGNFAPTPTHYFMRLLHQKGLLQRCFTQNIDSLEHLAGLPKEAVVAAHGNFDSAHCIRCGRPHAVEYVRKAVFAGEGNPCICQHKGCGGLVKPDIVFFGENLPERFWQLVPSDFPKADLLIVMGTSLVVQPFASLIDRVSADTPRLLINRERAGESDPMLFLSGLRRGFNFDEGNYRDALFEGDCDAGVRELCRLLGWEQELDALIEAGPPPEAPPTWRWPKLLPGAAAPSRRQRRLLQAHRLHLMLGRAQRARQRRAVLLGQQHEQWQQERWAGQPELPLPGELGREDGGSEQPGRHAAPWQQPPRRDQSAAFHSVFAAAEELSDSSADLKGGSPGSGSGGFGVPAGLHAAAAWPRLLPRRRRRLQEVHALHRTLHRAKARQRRGLLQLVRELHL